MMTIASLARRSPHLFIAAFAGFTGFYCPSESFASDSYRVEEGTASGYWRLDEGSAEPGKFIEVAVALDASYALSVPETISTDAQLTGLSGGGRIAVLYTSPILFKPFLAYAYRGLYSGSQPVLDSDGTPTGSSLSGNVTASLFSIGTAIDTYIFRWEAETGLAIVNPTVSLDGNSYSSSSLAFLIGGSVAARVYEWPEGDIAAKLSLVALPQADIVVMTLGIQTNLRVLGF